MLPLSVFSVLRKIRQDGKTQIKAGRGFVWPPLYAASRQLSAENQHSLPNFCAVRRGCIYNILQQMCHFSVSSPKNGTFVY
jgi:hypothetical protein